MDRTRATGLALVIVSACAFGSGALFAKPVYASGVTWLTLLAWRFTIGAGLSWVWLLSGARRSVLLRMPRRAIAVAVALGVLYVGNSGTYYAGLMTVSASLAALLVYIYPPLVAVLTLRVGRPLSGTRPWAALAIAVVGVVMAVGGIDLSTAPPLAGLLLILASPIIYAVWIVLAARLSGERRTGAVDAGQHAAEGTNQTDRPDTVVMAAVMTTATAVVFWLAALATGTPVAPPTIPAAAWPGVIGIGAVSTFVAIQGFYAGAQRIGAAQAALVSTIEPAYTVALAALLLHEALTPLQIVGGAVILAGVVLAQTSPGSVPAPELRLADE
jgi:drug/metabolite transporter (DMT)-like permease